MLKSFLLGVCLVIGGSAAWAGDTPANPDTAKPAAAKAPAKTTCIATGSRIPRKAGDCGPTFGRVYTRDEIQRTGRTDSAAALKALDPAL
jgi:hypothetical protein